MALFGTAALATSAVIPMLAAPASANLAALGAVNAATGFPLWYQDTNGMQLAECNDAPCPIPRPDLTTPAATPANIGDENFFYAADTDITLGNGASVLLVEALEGAFIPTVADGNQIVFQRIRIRGKSAFTPGAAYTFTYPFGTRTITADATGTINDTQDSGCLTPPCGAAFGTALTGPISVFPTWDPAVAPAAPAGFIGDYATPHAITGAVGGINFFRIDGPNVGGVGVNTIQTNLFQVAGKFAFPVMVSPTALTFATQAVGTTSAVQNVTIANTGTANLTVSRAAFGGTNAADFTLPVNTCTAAIAPGRSCTLGVAFAPVAAGNRTGTLTITDNAVGSPRVVTLTGTAVQPLTFTPTTLNFGNQLTNATSAPQTINVVNTGNASVTFSSVSTTGANAAEFAVSTNTCTTLAVGASCAVSVTFSPTAAGVRTASLSLVDNAPGSPQLLALTGTGQVPTPGFVASPTALPFGNQLINTVSAARSATITNNGTAPLSISSITLTGANAAQFGSLTHTCPASLAIGASCSVNVAFAPTTGGLKSAAISVADNAPGAPHSIGLSGTGTLPAPGALISPTNLVFPDAQRNTQGATMTVTVTNNGDANSVLHVTNVAIGGARAREFVVVTNGCAGSALAVGAQCAVTVRFVPTGTGLRNATLTISSDAPTTPPVALSGNGTAQAPANPPPPPPPPPPGGNPPPPPPPPPAKNGGKGKG
jgi:hypothetical protein